MNFLNLYVYLFHSSNGVVYLYLHLLLGLTITPALDMKKTVYDWLLFALFVFGSRKKGDLLPCFILFHLQKKRKKVIARLKCLTGALMYTNDIG